MPIDIIVKFVKKKSSQNIHVHSQNGAQYDCLHHLQD